MICLKKFYSTDGSIKYLWQLSDGKTIESIYFKFRNIIYTCISSQVGCDVKCSFCETGKHKNLRNLNSEEIYGQVAEIKQDLRAAGMAAFIQEVAVAGMGEPLFNFENLIKAISNIINDDLAKSISITTSGVAPKIRDLASTAVTKLFISLHATTDELRNYLVPVNKKYPISELLRAANYFFENIHSPVTVSYILFDGLNDLDEDLKRLKQLLDPQIFIIQLCEWNKISNIKYKQSPKIVYFHEELISSGYNVYISRSKGVDIEGGCGQLRSRYISDLFSSK